MYIRIKGVLFKKTAKAKYVAKKQYFLGVCDCGKERYFLFDKLKGENFRDCGCGTYKVKKVETFEVKEQETLRPLPEVKDSAFVGQRFGNLVIIRDDVGRKHGRVVKECVCDCGNVIQETTDKITSGIVSHCGCQREWLNKENAPDKIVRVKTSTGRSIVSFVGVRFGDVVVVKDEGKRDDKYLYRELLCDCGATEYGRLDKLHHGLYNKCKHKKEGVE